ncbi:aminotransferase class V-fold PLP-dependent enzyme [Desulfatiglans anilini]|uniref:aminotransferase class V-fold PLP-dependent enzyme n=1 Tax=Desulfatiglans anilini TaxID=90728 RepID=UPI00041EEEE8|nr:aminotransferase class V-fold PLP-dependent enzyme [Desulfatiglans anilini]
MREPIIYLDNAATTFPKPRAVLEQMLEIYSRMGVSPGRGSYDLAVEAEGLVQETRRKVAALFRAPDADHVIFAQNATDALNLALQGIVRPGDHVLSTRLEHNSVLRPLYHLRQRGWIEYDLVPFDGEGFVDPDAIALGIKSNTRLVVVCHASNVLGTVQTIPEIGRICAERGVPLIIDAAQSAGVIPIDMEGWEVAGVAFTGHKSLLGPTGIGGLALDPKLEIASTRFGGTGVDSKSLVHTQTFPHRLEAGTVNLLGIIGLSAGIDFLLAEGIEAVHTHEMRLLDRLYEGLSQIDRVQVFGQLGDPSRHVGLLTLNIKEISPEDAGMILDADFNIAARTGLHCAPLVHERFGTYPHGAVRFSLGPFNTLGEIDRTLEAMAMIAR